ncbi:MAG: GNAT family N-acetyltransferase [Bacteroidota bacterium]
MAASRLSNGKAEIRKTTPTDASWMAAGFLGMGWAKPDGYFEARLLEQASDALVVLVARVGEAYAGHGLVRWESSYEPFAVAGIPEIQDLNVLPGYRNRGIGTQLLDAAESSIATRSPLAGIGVGLYADYGAAQRLYAGRGYLPDGCGISYDNKPVIKGEQYPVDDSMVLHFIKKLR